MFVTAKRHAVVQHGTTKLSQRIRYIGGDIEKSSKRKPRQEAPDNRFHRKCFELDVQKAIQKPGSRPIRHHRKTGGPSTKPLPAFFSSARSLTAFTYCYATASPEPRLSQAASVHASQKAHRACAPELRISTSNIPVKRAAGL